MPAANAFDQDRQMYRRNATQPQAWRKSAAASAASATSAATPAASTSRSISDPGHRGDAGGRDGEQSRAEPGGSQLAQTRAASRRRQSGARSGAEQGGRRRWDEGRSPLQASRRPGHLQRKLRVAVPSLNPSREQIKFSDCTDGAA